MTDGRWAATRSGIKSKSSEIISFYNQVVEQIFKRGEYVKR